MAELKIVLPGRIPSKKNSKQWIVRGGRRFLVPSLNHSAWHDSQLSRIIENRVRPLKPITRCQVMIDIYFPDKHRYDLTNKAESIMDLLVDARIIEDDSHEICYDIHLVSMGVDRSNPRAEIIIYNYENNFTSPS